MKSFTRHARYDRKGYNERQRLKEMSCGTRSRTRVPHLEIVNDSRGQLKRGQQKLCTHNTNLSYKRVNVTPMRVTFQEVSNISNIPFEGVGLSTSVTGKDWLRRRWFHYN